MFQLSAIPVTNRASRCSIFTAEAPKESGDHEGVEESWEDHLATEGSEPKNLAIWPEGHVDFFVPWLKMYHFSPISSKHVLQKNARFFIDHPGHPYIWAHLSDVLRSFPQKMPLQLRCSRSRNASYTPRRWFYPRVPSGWLKKPPNKIQ